MYNSTESSWAGRQEIEIPRTTLRKGVGYPLSAAAEGGGGGGGRGGGGILLQEMLGNQLSSSAQTINT